MAQEYYKSKTPAEGTYEGNLLKKKSCWLGTTSQAKHALGAFEHEACIDFALILGWILISCLMLVGYLFRSRTQPVETSKKHKYNDLNNFTVQRDMIFDDFHDSSFTSFGIDLE